ncbi:YycH family regulatory protein [Ornithinibacillus californiensis]|uniref:YycH family regulatory protein n=1 Tax=Ornithinibacillus californiensis TaxID=161536 RepID=UPI00064DCD42|nr:two-component system activity regulator YycH [Ornithinibacillus californiensis]
MKLEVIKSYTLAILVGISLILSISLWSYSPNDDLLDEEQLLDPSELDLGGTEKTKKAIVQPSQIIFSKNKFQQSYFGFANPNDRIKLYNDMTSWVLYNFRAVDGNGRPNNDLLVELIYPEELPMEIIPNLFTVNNQDNFGIQENLSFQRVYITFSESTNSLTFIFLSTDGKTQLRADVNNTQKYEVLDNYIKNLTGLEEYIKLEDREYPVYLPIEPKMTYYTWTTYEPANEANIIKNALFPYPKEVVENRTEENITWYQDGTRAMQVFEHELSLEFIDPQEEMFVDPMNTIELLDKGIAEINGYKGWLHDYHLEDVNRMNNLITYQMHYKGYPVFNPDNLATIEQRLVNNELAEHRQPIYKIYTTASENYVLETGLDVINHLKNTNSLYNISEIQDIRVGYRLSYHVPADQNAYISLTPTWYIKVNDIWQQVLLEDDIHREEVS